MGMYAKLMSRITESSLMDEDIPVRYCFVMLLAIADPQGYVVGTDIAIARRLNMPLEDFRRCIHQLMQPDPDSNSKEEEGRRVIESDCERGYFLVNYRKYRDTRDEEQRREWMREYMRKYRAGKTVADVNNCKQCNPPLAKEEAEGKEEEKEKKGKETSNASSINTEKNDVFPTSERSKKIADLFKRRHTTAWDEKEIKAYRCTAKHPDEDFNLVVEFYEKSNSPYLRKDLGTFLNNFTGELDRARAWKNGSLNGKPKLLTAAEAKAKQAAMDAEMERRANAAQS